MRQAAAICLGSLSIGNTNFFLPKVFELIGSSNSAKKLMYMSTMREIIKQKPECLQAYVQNLMPLYIANSNSEDQNIRNIVAESIGSLYVIHSQAMMASLTQALNSTDVVT